MVIIKKIKHNKEFIGVIKEIRSGRDFQKSIEMLDNLLQITETRAYLKGKKEILKTINKIQGTNLQIL
jgi:hypothetical protein